MARQNAALASKGPLQERSLSFSLVVLEHARDHATLYRALVNDRGGSVALGFVREILGDLIRTELASFTFAVDQTTAGREVIVQYLVGAFMSLMIWWLDGGAKLSPQQVDAMFRGLSMAGIAPPCRILTDPCANFNELIAPA